MSIEQAWFVLFVMQGTHFWLCDNMLLRPWNLDKFLTFLSDCVTIFYLSFSKKLNPSWRLSKYCKFVFEKIFYVEKKLVVLCTVADLGTLHFAISHFVMELQYQQNMIILKQCFKIFVYNNYKYNKGYCRRVLFILWKADLLFRAFCLRLFG